MHICLWLFKLIILNEDNLLIINNQSLKVIRMLHKIKESSDINDSKLLLSSQFLQSENFLINIY